MWLREHSGDPPRASGQRVKRLALGGAIGIAIGVIVGAALGLRAEQEPTDEARSWAEQTGTDPLAVQGALNSVREVYPGLSAEQYLASDGLLNLPDNPPPDVMPPPCGWPICGALGQRLYCIEAIESRHGQAMFNAVPWGRWSEHAQGWLGWLPSTARSVGAVIGNRWSEWQGAARMLALGRGREFFGVAAGRC